MQNRILVGNIPESLILEDVKILLESHGPPIQALRKIVAGIYVVVYSDGVQAQKAADQLYGIKIDETTTISTEYARKIFPV